MLIQEAIEIAKRKIEECERYKIALEASVMDSDLKLDVMSEEDYKEVMKETNDEIECLSIILESAKLLHKVADISPVYGGEMKLSYFELEDYYLDEDQTKAIGVEYEVLEEDE